MSRWSREQDEYLLEHAHEGLERVQADMRRRFGVARTPEAIRRHAYRIGAPLVRYEQCPECGRKVDHLVHGLCYACNQHLLAETHRAKAEALRAEVERNSSLAERRRAEREVEREKARASRLRRKLRKQQG